MERGRHGGMKEMQDGGMDDCMYVCIYGRMDRRRKGTAGLVQVLQLMLSFTLPSHNLPFLWLLGPQNPPNSLYSTLPNGPPRSGSPLPLLRGAQRPGVYVLNTSCKGGSKKKSAQPARAGERLQGSAH